MVFNLVYTALSSLHFVPQKCVLIPVGTSDADDGLTEEVKKLLDLAIQNLIERMLHSEGYITLGTWFARPDPTTQSLFLYRLNYFNQESSYWVCAALSVMQVSVSLKAFSKTELCQAESLKGRKVVLSPCGLSGQLTGRSYTEETQGNYSRTSLIRILRTVYIILHNRYSYELLTKVSTL